MSQDRLISYLINHLDPIDLIKEYQNKTLPVSILFYKMCSSFPKEKIGSMKGAFKHIQQEKMKVFKQVLTPEEFNYVIKQQNFNRPKIGQYLEFISLSLLQTCVEQPELLNFSSLQQDISEGWDFKFNGQKYDLTTNQNKISRPEVKLIKLPVYQLVDQDNLLLPQAFSVLAEEFKKHNITLSFEKLNYTKTIVNKVRSKYIELSNHQVKLIPQTSPVLMEKNSPVVETVEVPPLDGEVLSVESKQTKISSINQETLKLLENIEKLTPTQRQHLQAIINSMITSPQ